MKFWLSVLGYLVPYRQRRGFANAKRLVPRRGYANALLYPTYDLSLIRVLLSKISFKINVTAASRASKTAAEKAASVLYCL